MPEFTIEDDQRVHRDRMDRPVLPNEDQRDADLMLFFEGLESGLIILERGGRFTIVGRPTSGGRRPLPLFSHTEGGATPSATGGEPIRGRTTAGLCSEQVLASSVTVVEQSDGA